MGANHNTTDGTSRFQTSLEGLQTSKQDKLIMMSQYVQLAHPLEGTSKCHP